MKIRINVFLSTSILFSGALKKDFVCGQVKTNLVKYIQQYRHHKYLMTATFGLSSPEKYGCDLSVRTTSLSTVHWIALQNLCFSSSLLFCLQSKIKLCQINVYFQHCLSCQENKVNATCVYSLPVTAKDVMLLGTISITVELPLYNHSIIWLPFHITATLIWTQTLVISYMFLFSAIAYTSGFSWL